MELNDLFSEEKESLEAFERIKLLIKVAQLATDHPFFREPSTVKDGIDELLNLLGWIAQNALNAKDAFRLESTLEAQNLALVEAFPSPITFLFDKPFPKDRACISWASCTRKFTSSGSGSPTKLLILTKKEMIRAIQNDIALKLQAYYSHPSTWLRLNHIAYCQWSQMEGVEGNSLILEYKVY